MALRPPLLQSSTAIRGAFFREQDLSRFCFKFLSSRPLGHCKLGHVHPDPQARQLHHCLWKGDVTPPRHPTAIPPTWQSLATSSVIPYSTRFCTARHGMSSRRTSLLPPSCAMTAPHSSLGVTLARSYCSSVFGQRDVRQYRLWPNSGHPLNPKP